MDAAFAAYFAALSGEPERIARGLHDAISRAGPDLAGQLSHGYPAWRGRDWVFSVVAHRAHCNLQLARGAELAAHFPDRIEGTGKSLRHVKVRSEDEIDAELEDIIAAAIALDQARPPRTRKGKG